MLPGQNPSVLRLVGPLLFFVFVLSFLPSLNLDEGKVFFKDKQVAFVLNHLFVPSPRLPLPVPLAPIGMGPPIHNSPSVPSPFIEFCLIMSSFSRFSFPLEPVFFSPNSFPVYPL